MQFTFPVDDGGKKESEQMSKDLDYARQLEDPAAHESDGDTNRSRSPWNGVQEPEKTIGELEI